MFKMATGTDMLHVPYKGTAPLITALMAGEIQVAFDYATVVAPQVQAGRVRALAIAGPQRLPALPDVPTTTEAGLPGFESEVWIGYFAPAGTPKDIVNLLQREIAKATENPQFVESMKLRGNQIVASTPEAFAQFLKVDKAKWGKVVKAANIRLE
jgi:tripartite-type tricarboxylate transporter receptor subunit TctC